MLTGPIIIVKFFLGDFLVKNDTHGKSGSDDDALLKPVPNSL